MDFTPNQKYSLLSKMGYTGSVDNDSMDQFIQSNPGAAAKMGKFQRALTRGFQTGGLVAPGQTVLLGNKNFTGDPSNRPYSVPYVPPAPTTVAPTTPTAATPTATPTAQLDFQSKEFTPFTGDIGQAQQDFLSSQIDLVNAQRKLDSVTPTITTGVDGKVSIEGTDKTFDSTEEAQKFIEANSASYRNAVKALEAAQSKFSQGQQALDIIKSSQQVLAPTGASLAARAVQDPSSLIVKADAARASAPSISSGVGQAGGAAPVAGAAQASARTADEVEAIPTVTFEATEVAPEVEKTLEELRAVTGEPTKEATVRGQLELLMEDFEGGGTPPWASGAMREAMGIMQQRGLGASSIAGQAVVQAAMESALGIATQDAATTAQFELQSMSNEQQTIIFRTQQRINSLLSDQAAVNASRQFNAASENQTNQFFADLKSTVSRFNADQINAISQFNAGQSNAISQFNASLQAQRDEFNANSRLVIAQANARWRAEISIANTMAQNEANMQAAQAANNLTSNAMDQVWQRERDLMNFAFQTAENSQDRYTELLIADKRIAAEQVLQAQELSAADKAGKGAILGSIVGEVVPGLVGKIFGF